MNPINPRPFLDEVTGRWVSVKLKWGWELRGILKSSDAYMNLHVNTKYYVDPEFRGMGQWRKQRIIRRNIDQVNHDLYLRCNNVLYIR